MVLIGRKHQIDTLEKYAKFSSLILLYGHPYTGKSIVLQSLLQERLQGQLTVLVNGKRIYSSSDLYREILQQLRKWLDERGLETSAEAEEEKSFIIKDIPVEELTTDDTCHSTNHSHKERSTQFSTGKSTPRKLNFINFFRLLMQTMAHFEKISSIMEHRTIYIALDHVEYLVERNVISELRRLLRINDQLNSRMSNNSASSKWNAVFLMATRGISPGLMNTLSPFLPSLLHFPLYTILEIADILRNQFQISLQWSTLFRKWIRAIADRLDADYNNWMEFRHTAIRLLPIFIAGIDNDNNSVNVEKFLIQTTHRQMMQNRRRDHQFESKFDRTTTTRRTDFSFLEKGRHHSLGSILLPRKCLFLLIAAFLASFTLQQNDILFISASGNAMKKRKRQRVAEPAKSSGQNPNNQLQIGPKIFSHQRLSAIYFSLALEYTSTSSQSVELNPETREEVFTHIATLLRIKLMQQVSATQVLDNIKYRCLATWELVQDAAKSLHFPVDMYLNNHL